MYEVGKRYLITTDGWFIAPDGEQYRAVFGTLKAVHSSETALGVKTNSRSTNWYVEIGGMMIAGCQIHYVARTDRYSDLEPTVGIEHDGKMKAVRGSMPLIFDADEDCDVDDAA